MNRRQFLLGLGVSAPAAIAATNLMKVEVLRESIIGKVLQPGIYHIRFDSTGAFVVHDEGETYLQEWHIHFPVRVTEVHTRRGALRSIRRV